MSTVFETECLMLLYFRGIALSKENLSLHYDATHNPNCTQGLNLNIICLPAFANALVQYSQGLLQ